MILRSSKIPLASVFNVVKCYLVEFEKDKFPGPDPSALLLLSRHFRSHPLPNYFVFGFYRFSSRSFSFRRSFCLHSAVLHCTMGFILVVLKRVFPWTVVTALSHHHWHGEIHFNLPFKFRLILNFSFTLGRTTVLVLS